MVEGQSRVEAQIAGEQIHPPVPQHMLPPQGTRPVVDYALRHSGSENLSEGSAPSSDALFFYNPQAHLHVIEPAHDVTVCEGSLGQDREVAEGRPQQHMKHLGSWVGLGGGPAIQRQLFKPLLAE